MWGRGVEITVKGKPLSNMRWVVKVTLDLEGILAPI